MKINGTCTCICCNEEMKKTGNRVNGIDIEICSRECFMEFHNMSEKDMEYDSKCP